MIMCVLLCYPVSIRIYYQQGGLFLVVLFKGFFITFVGPEGPKSKFLAFEKRFSPFHIN